MKRQLMVAILSLGALLGVVSDNDAQPLIGPINVAALPLPDARCPNITQSAIANDSGSDTDAFQCAVKLLPATVGGFQGAGEIYVPAGVYRLDAPISVLDKSVAFRGEGKQISRLVWDGVTDGLTFKSTSSGLNYTLAVRSLSLIKRNAVGGAAIRGEWPADGGPHDAHGVVTTTIHDVHTGTCALESAPDGWNNCSAVSWPDDTLHWDFGIQLTRVTAAKISAFDIQGGGVAGIQLAGMTATEDPQSFWHKFHKSISVQIRDGVITKATRGIETRDKIEGLHVSSVSIREVHWGLELKGTPCDPATSPLKCEDKGLLWTIPGGLGTAVSNNYILARYRGIEATRSHAMTITNNLIERFESADFMGIRVWSGTDFRLTGNTVRSAAGGVGIVLEGTSQENLIAGNTTANMNTGISVVGLGVIKNVVTGNRNVVTAPALPFVIGPNNPAGNNH